MSFMSEQRRDTLPGSTDVIRKEASSTAPTFTLSVWALTTLALFGSAWRSRRRSRNARSEAEAWKRVAMNLLDSRGDPQRHLIAVQGRSLPSAVAAQDRDGPNKQVHGPTDQKTPIDTGIKSSEALSQSVSANINKTPDVNSSPLKADGIVDRYPYSAIHPHEDWHWTPMDHPRPRRAQVSRQGVVRMNASSRQKEWFASSQSWNSSEHIGRGKPSDKESTTVDPLVAKGGGGEETEGAAKTIVEKSGNTTSSEGQDQSPTQTKATKNTTKQLLKDTSTSLQQSDQEIKTESESNANQISHSNEADKWKEEEMASIIWPQGDPLHATEKATIAQEAIRDTLIKNTADSPEYKSNQACERAYESTYNPAECMVRQAKSQEDRNEYKGEQERVVHRFGNFPRYSTLERKHNCASVHHSLSPAFRFVPLIHWRMPSHAELPGSEDQLLTSKVLYQQPILRHRLRLRYRVMVQ